MCKYDLAVIGGGFAGVSAALAAARSGAKVILVEKANCLGGAATNCLVNPFMPYKTKINGETVELSAGIFAEIRDRMASRNAMLRDYFLEEELKYVLNEMIEEAGVQLLLRSYIHNVIVEKGIIKSVSLANIAGDMEVTADYFIDATGDAQLTYLAGYPVRLGREPDELCQPMTLCFRVGNVDVEQFMESKNKMNEEYVAHREAGLLSNPRENILVFKTPISNVLHFNTTRIVKKNPTNPQDVTEAEILARKQVFEIYDFIKAHSKGMEHSFLMMTASEIGVRESRMIVGEHILTERECINCEKFYDSIAACNYDIDIHNPEGTGTSHHYFKDGEYYTIPYRSLIPKEASNLLVAGRCISSDHGAQASYRVMTVVCCIGEAAGTAMGLAIRDKVKVSEIDTVELQNSLKEKKAFIGI